MKIKGLVPAMDGTDRLVDVELEITDPDMITKINMGQIKDLSLDLKPALPVLNAWGSHNLADRNARAYGFEIGRGVKLATQIVISEDNPFMNQDWRDNIIKKEEN